MSESRSTRVVGGLFARVAGVLGLIAMGVVAGCGGGGGGGGGDSACSAITVYDSYGYSGSTSGEIDEPMSFDLTTHVQSGCALPHKLTGKLPAGLSFDSRTGKISGTPTEAGEFTVIVQPDVASSNVSARLNLVVQPLGRASLTATPTKLNAPANLDMRIGASLAVATESGLTHLWIGAIRPGTGRYELLASSDGGVNWTADNGGGLMAPRGNSYGTYKLTAFGAVAFVLDTGGSRDLVQMPSVLYRFDGHAWQLRNEQLPFRAPQGAALYAKSADALAVAWGDNTGVVLWTSADGGSNWQRVDSSGGFMFGTPRGEGQFCLGSTGTDWRFAGEYNGSVVQSTLLTGTTTWAEPIWAWGDYAVPFSVCASDGDRFWVAGTGNTTDQNYLTLSDAVAGESATVFPRRVRTVGPTDSRTIFDSMAASSGQLYGLVAAPNGHTGYELWRLR